MVQGVCTATERGPGAWAEWTRATEAERTPEQWAMDEGSGRTTAEIAESGHWAGRISEKSEIRLGVVSGNRRLPNEPGREKRSAISRTEIVGRSSLGTGVPTAAGSLGASEDCDTKEAAELRRKSKDGRDSNDRRRHLCTAGEAGNSATRFKESRALINSDGTLLILALLLEWNDAFSSPILSFIPITRYQLLSVSHK